MTMILASIIRGKSTDTDGWTIANMESNRDLAPLSSSFGHRGDEVCV